MVPKNQQQKFLTFQNCCINNQDCNNYYSTDFVDAFYFTDFLSILVTEANIIVRLTIRLNEIYHQHGE